MASKRVEQESKSAPSTADVQRSNSGGRDERGRFSKGNSSAFKPGQSGNPKGRSAASILSDAMRRLLAESYPGDKHGRTWAEVIAFALVDAAAKGDVRAAKEIADRTEGKPRRHITLTYDLREKLEMSVAGIMEDSKCTREVAIRALAVFRPDALVLLNTN